STAAVAAAVHASKIKGGKTLGTTPLRLSTQLRLVGDQWREAPFAPAPCIGSSGSEGPLLPAPRRPPSPHPTRRPYGAAPRKHGGGRPGRRPRPAPYSAQLEDLTGTEDTAARTTEAVGAEETPTVDAKAAGASAEPVEEQAAAEGAEPEARAAEVDDRAAEVD